MSKELTSARSVVAYGMRAIKDENFNSETMIDVTLDASMNNPVSSGTKIIIPYRDGDYEQVYEVPNKCVRLSDGTMWCHTYNVPDNSNEAGVKAAIKAEFGDSAVILDWSDLIAYHSVNGDLQPMFDLATNLNITLYSGIYGICQYYGDYTQSSSKKYFVASEAQYHTSSFSVFATLGVGEGTHGDDLANMSSGDGQFPCYVKIPTPV